MSPFSPGAPAFLGEHGSLSPAGSQKVTQGTNSPPIRKQEVAGGGGRAALPLTPFGPGRPASP